jgi:hypothetical protein
MRAPSVLGLAVLGVGLFGCNNPRYIQENRPLDAEMPMMMMGQMMVDPNVLADTDLFVLPIRKPTADEKKALVAEQQKLGLPMPVPWVGLRDVDLQFDWTLKNLEQKDITARITINGGNEFGDYDKALFVDATAAPEDQTVPPDILGGGKFMPLLAGEIRSGVFREDELHEAGIDLEAITRYPAPGAGMNEPFMVLERESSASTVGLEGVPANDVTPAMVRLSILLEATGRAVLDYSVRVRENGSPRDKLAAPGDANLYVSTAAMLAPPVTPTAAPAP